MTHPVERRQPAHLEILRKLAAGLAACLVGPESSWAARPPFTSTTAPPGLFGSVLLLGLTVLALTLMFYVLLGARGVVAAVLFNIVLFTALNGANQPLQPLPRFLEGRANLMPFRYAADGARALLFLTASLAGAVCRLASAPAGNAVPPPSPRRPHPPCRGNGRKRSSMVAQTVQPKPLSGFLPKEFARPQPLEEALADAATAVSRYRAWLQTVPDALLHLPVSPGSWSVAEHAHHLIRTSEVFAASMHDLAEDRPMVRVNLTSAWPDGRLVAPPPIHPAPGLPREALLEGLQSAQQELERAARRLASLGLQDVPCVPTGIFEPMTAVETAQLVAGHTLHHIRTPPTTQRP